MSQSSGAWLVVRSRSAPPGSCEPVALPVPRQACLGLARAVLANCDDAERWLALCGGDAAVRDWLAAAGECNDAAAASVMRPGPPQRARLLRRLADDLVIGAPPSGAQAVELACETTPEAALLVEVVEHMQVHDRIAGDFAAAVEGARLEAARELAYGAGHEINNPLANIATRAQSLLLEEREPERRRRLATIVDQSFRARDMIGGLMLFARPPKPRVEEADVGELLESVRESIGQLAAARGAHVEARSPAPAVLVSVDRGQIEEALRAIALNAVEAVAVGGTVTLAADAGGGGEWCEITVVDDGNGMDEATIRRAFDPFFSGREAGRGAGLGLSKAWRFVEASGGNVSIESRPGVGTAVSVRLPRHTGGRVCAVSPG